MNNPTPHTTIANVDNPQEHTITLGSLCTGYAGLELGLSRGLRAIGYVVRTAFAVEVEAFACANLVAKMESGLLDAAPIWTNIKTFDGAPFRGLVDILTGGYPCQPFSTAGLRKGTDDPRHLWPFIRGIIQAVEPLWCFFENVEGHLSLGYSDVYKDLRSLGYAVEAVLYTAAEVGAPHQRRRLFILAHRNTGRQPQSQGSQSAQRGRTLDGGEAVADARRDGRWQDEPGREPEERAAAFGSGASVNLWPAPYGAEQYAWEPPRVVVNTRGARSQQPANEVCAGWDAVDGAGVAAVANAERSRDQCEEQRNEVEWTNRDGSTGGPGGSGVEMADASRQRRNGTGDAGQRGRRELADEGERQAQSPLGRNPDGHPDRMAYAELYRACDSRIDELRLAGNGCVPAEVAKAFLHLYERFYPNTETPDTKEHGH